MSQLRERFTRHIQDEQLLDKRMDILLAFSGGVDSVVLAHLLQSTGFTIVLAHANFNLRAEESLRDQEFCINFAGRHGLSIRTTALDAGEYAAQHRVSIQVAARVLRYQWFDDLMRDPGLFEQGQGRYRRLLTAHHADDNIETVLMHIFRGTGIRGMRGMLPEQNNILRPLLPFFKEEILEYARLNQLSWVEDSSNASVKYSRNYLRNVLLPVVEEVYPSAGKVLFEHIHRFREIEMIYLEAVDRYRKILFEIRGKEVYIPVLKLKKLPGLQTILFELMQPFGFSAAQTPDLLKLLSSNTGKYCESHTHRVIRNRAWLIISAVQDRNSSVHIVDPDTDSILLPEGRLRIKAVTPSEANIFSDPYSVYLDARTIEFPLVVRRWKAGDYFYPLGMRKKKKLSRFLIDKKMSLTDKEKVYVVESGGRIIWVIGHRIDDRVKLNPASERILHCSYEVISD